MQTELDSPFPTSPFNEDDLLRRPFQRTSARALGKKGLKDGLDKEIIISIGGRNVYFPLKSTYKFYLKGFILLSIRRKMEALVLWIVH